MQKILSKQIKKGYSKNGELVLYFLIEEENENLALSQFEILKEESSISIKLKKEYGKRTGKQNKMFWSLVGKISMFLNGNQRKSSIDRVYFELLREANVGNEFLWISESELEEKQEKYKLLINTKHTKRYNGEIFRLYDCFKGTSELDKKDMAELIETALDKVAFLGIEDAESQEIRSNLSKIDKN